MGNRTIVKGATIITYLTYLVTMCAVVWLGLVILGGFTLWVIPLDLILFYPVLRMVRATFGWVLATLFGFAYGLYLDIWGDKN